MLKEAVGFRIDEDIESLVLENADLLAPLDSYQRTVDSRMKNSYPQIYLIKKFYGLKMADQSLFDYSTAFFFDLARRQLGRQGIKLKFEEGDLVRFNENAKAVFNRPEWANKEWVRQELEHPERRDSSLADFLNSLESTAPLIEDRLATELLEFPSPLLVKDVLFGAYIGFMPFYLKMTDNKALNELFDRECKNYPAREWVRMDT